MHRLLVETAALASSSPSLPEAARAHLKVLRPRDGERFELFDGRGGARVYGWSAATRALLAAAAPRPVAPRPASLTLFACVTKGSRWDWTVEKAVELGVTRLVPVLSERTVVRIAATEREAKRARWQRIAEDAARQSDALWLPEIRAAVDFAEALALVGATRCFVGALTDPPPPPLGEALLGLVREGAFAAAPPPLAVFTGPEGDFTPSELAALLAVATPASFGTTILRAETAAIYGVGALKTFLDLARRDVRLASDG